MSVIIDQLRVSDDGQRLYLDAHVNQSSYFDDVRLSKITICTEDMVSETSPETCGSKYIYRKDVGPVVTITPVYAQPQVLSAEQLLSQDYEVRQHDGWTIDIHSLPDTETSYLSMAFSGKFSALSTGYVPKLVVASAQFNPYSEGFNSAEVFFVVDGVSHTDSATGHSWWQFQGKGEIKHQNPYFYLYKQTSDSAYEIVNIADDTDDVNFLHFLWQVYGQRSDTDTKEVHLMLTKADFDAAYLNYNQDSGEVLDDSKAFATVSFSGSDLSHNMFFVYIETTPLSAETPCYFGGETTLGVTFDYGLIYQQAMGYTRELSDDCDVPRGFIDYILNYEALKLSLETEHWIPAIGYWKELTDSGNVTTSYGTKGCRCHG